MAVSPIPPKALQILRAFIKLNISVEQLEKGFTLFKQPESVEWEYADDETLIAVCQEGGDNFRVELAPYSADEPVFCSCGDMCCRHSLTVFLHVLRVAGKIPEMFLMECEAAAKERVRRETHKELAAADEPPAPELMEADRFPGKPGKKSKAKSAFPKPGDSAEGWQGYFHERYHKELVIPRPGAYLFGLERSVTDFYFRVVEEMADGSAGWPPTVRGLFVLHAQLYAMEAIEQFFNRLPFNPGQVYGMSQLARELAGAASQHAEDIFAHMDLEMVCSDHGETIKEALTLLRQGTFKATPPHLDWSSLYRTIWFKLYAFSGEWAAEEQAKLEEMRLQGNSSGLDARVRLSLVLFDFLAGNDEAALAKLKADSSLAQVYYAPYLRELYEQEAWSRLLVWLQGLTRFLRRESYLLNRTVFPIWLEAAEAQPEEPGWLDWIKKMLPQSRDVYITYLIENGEARKVAHMLLTEGYPIYYVDKGIMRLLEKTDLRLVLPLYHQDAERYILEKNRQSYKQAVRLLKKLAGFYKKLKEQDRWQLYIGQLAERHSRLRAFQEELRRGKLIV